MLREIPQISVPPKDDQILGANVGARKRSGLFQLGDAGGFLERVQPQMEEPTLAMRCGPLQRLYHAWNNPMPIGPPRLASWWGDAMTLCPIRLYYTRHCGLGWGARGIRSVVVRPMGGRDVVKETYLCIKYSGMELRYCYDTVIFY